MFLGLFPAVVGAMFFPVPRPGPLPGGHPRIARPVVTRPRTRTAALPLAAMLLT